MEENKTFNLNDILANTKLDKVTAEGTGFENLKDGYYLCDVKDATYGSSKSGLPMVTVVFKVAEDGVVADADEAGNPFNRREEGTKGREFRKFYVLTDSDSVKRFVSDMLKFENKEIVGEPLLSAECFGSEEMMVDALSLIKTEAGVASRIYVQASNYVDKKTNEPNIRYYLISWKRAGQLKLDEVE